MSDDERAGLVERLRDLIAEALADLYTCSRVWEAWQYGTMTADDFTPASEDEDVIQNVIDAVLPMFLAKIEADGKRLALAEKTIADAKAAADDAGMVNWEENNYAAGAQMVAAVLSDYDAAKEALS